jgi:hypothetical protein
MVHAIVGIRPAATRLDGAEFEDLMGHREVE